MEKASLSGVCEPRQEVQRSFVETRRIISTEKTEKPDQHLVGKNVWKKDTKKQKQLFYSVDTLDIRRTSTSGLLALKMTSLM